MTVEAWVREVETKMTCDPEAMCGRAFCSKGQYQNLTENKPGGEDSVLEPGSMGL